VVVVCLATLGVFCWKKQISGSARAGDIIIILLIRFHYFSFVSLLSILFLVSSSSSGGSSMPGDTGGLSLGEADRCVCARRCSDDH